MAKPKNKGGRPKKGEGPRLSDPEAVERLLVEGELVTGPDGETTRVWPTQREVAERFGVAASGIANFAKKHRTTERRAELQKQVEPAASTPKVEPVKPSPPASNVVRETYDSDDDESEEETAKRRPGRPRRQDAPLIPFDELDRLLVFGEVKILEDGKTTTVYPTYRTLAEKYGVVVSVIADYARSHNTMKRRKLAEMRIEVRKDEKIVELRTDALAVGEARLLAMIDDFLLKFEEALREGRVRTDSAADVNTLVRLKQYIQGGADSRTEVRSILSLEALQERYAKAQRDLESATPAMTGVVISVRPEPSTETEQAETNGAAASAPTPARSVSDSAPIPNLSRSLRAAVLELLSAARELAESLGAEPDDDTSLEGRVLRSVARVEAALIPRDEAGLGERER